GNAQVLVALHQSGALGGGRDGLAVDVEQASRCQVSVGLGRRDLSVDGDGIGNAYGRAAGRTADARTRDDADVQGGDDLAINNSRAEVDYSVHGYQCAVHTRVTASRAAAAAGKGDSLAGANDVIEHIPGLNSTGHHDVGAAI